MLRDSCAQPPGWCPVGELWLSVEHVKVVLLCGHMDLMDFRSGSVVLDLWFQSRLVSASPMRLMSNVVNAGQVCCKV